MNSNRATYTGFEFELEGYPAMAIINKDLKAMEDRFAYGHSVFIEIIPDTYNAYGHPEGAEYDYLLEVEKKIIEYLETQTRSLHVGHTTLHRKREIIFYTKDPEAVEGFLEHFLGTIERESAFVVEEDSEWEQVEGFYEHIEP